jgi:predicted GIY-YIG superfamily endonuclease
VYKAKDGNKEYIGISNNVKRRSYEHQRVNPDRKIYTVTEASYTRKEARAIEQYKIEDGKGKLTNKINSIRKNTKVYNKAMKDIEKLLETFKWIDFK